MPGPDAIVTTSMADALVLIDELGPLAQSNRTWRGAPDSEDPPTIHATTAQHLADAGLVMELGRDDADRQLWALTPEGQLFVQRRRSR